MPPLHAIYDHVTIDTNRRRCRRPQEAATGRKGGKEGMKALSIHPMYAMAIIAGDKAIECRSWKTDYRGDLLICSTNKKIHGTIPGHALGVVTLKDVVPFQKKHLKDALMMPADYRPGMYAWILGDNRMIEPVPVKGRLSLWEYTGDITYVPFEEWVLPDDADPEESTGSDWIKEHWEPLLV